VRKKVKLSAHVRKTITAEQRVKHAAFDMDVAVIWNSNLVACQELADKHHKTLRNCQDAVYLGAKIINGRHKKVSKWRAYVAATVKQINESA
jgi:hypothetical protein